MKNERIIVSYRKSNGHLSSNSSAVYKICNPKKYEFGAEQIIDSGADFVNTKYGIRNLIINELSDQRLVATYWVNDGKRGNAFYKVSIDGGLTWSRRIEIKDNEIDTALVGVEGKILEIKGRHILPVFIKKDAISNNFEAGVMISSDLLSWRFVAVSQKESNNNESAILFDLNTKELLFFYRNVTENALYRSTSNDLGRSWSLPKNVSFKGYIQSRPDIIIDSHENKMYLLFRESEFQTGAIAVSNDGGVTWKKMIGFQNDHSRFTYGGLVNIKKNKYLLIYSSEDKPNGEYSAIKSKFVLLK